MITVYIGIDNSCSMAIVRIGIRVVMEGNTWDFHPSCHGIYQYGDFNTPQELADNIKQLYTNNGIEANIQTYSYKYGEPDNEPKSLYSDLKCDHIYFYTISKESGAVIYDRTFPRDCMNSVVNRIKELQNRNIESLYTIGFTLPGAFY
jgi:hypothetical protein